MGDGRSLQTRVLGGVFFDWRSGDGPAAVAVREAGLRSSLEHGAALQLLQSDVQELRKAVSSRS